MVTFVAMVVRPRAWFRLGPIHVLAGHTDQLDPVSACGLTLPHADSLYGPAKAEFSEPKCGDCFPRKENR